MLGPVCCAILSHSTRCTQSSDGNLPMWKSAHSQSRAYSPQSFKSILQVNPSNIGRAAYAEVSGPPGRQIRTPRHHGPPSGSLMSATDQRSELNGKHTNARKRSARVWMHTCWLSLMRSLRRRRCSAADRAREVPEHYA